jgi:hypothetical protein
MKQSKQGLNKVQVENNEVHNYFKITNSEIYFETTTFKKHSED